jgi:hypothetical protein
MTIVSINVPEWILKDVIGNPINKSARISELLIKGYMQEKEKALKDALKSSNTDMGTFAKLVRACLFFSVKRRY